MTTSPRDGRESLLATLALALAFAMPSGCAAKPHDEPQPRATIAVSPPSSDDAVLQAVFAHELGAPPPRGEAVCLRVRTAPANALADPSDALLALLRKIYPTALKASGCSGGGPERVRVTASGDAAVISDIGPVVWDGPEAARVQGGGASRGGSLHIREVEYRVVNDGKGWRVASERVIIQN